MFNVFKKNFKLVFNFILIFLCSCSGGGTLGSSSTGGVTIKGQARNFNNGEAIANSPMSILTLDGKTEIASSETNQNGEFSMRVAKKKESVLVDIQDASSGFNLEEELLTQDELRLTVIDKKNISTEIEFYLGVKIETKGSCRVERSSNSSDLYIVLNSLSEECFVNIRPIFSENNLEARAKIFLCEELKFSAENNSFNEIRFVANEINCSGNIVKVKFETLNINLNFVEN
jgi:hypothetical protein